MVRIIYFNIELIHQTHQQRVHSSVIATDLSGTWNFVYGLGMIIRHVDSVSGIVYNNRSIFLGEGYELLQLFSGGSCPSGIIGRAEKDRICAWHF